MDQKKQQPINLHATLDGDNVLRIADSEGNVYSKRTIERNKHQGSFTFDDEKIHWIIEATNDRPVEEATFKIFLYPVNVKFSLNPLEVERHDGERKD